MPNLSYDDLLRALKKGSIPGALYLWGAEDVLKDEAVDEIIGMALDPSLRDFNLDHRSAASLDPEQAETLCNTLPMMADRRIVVIRDVEAWNKRAKAKTAVLRYLERPAPETILILVEGAPARADDRPESKGDPDLIAKTTSVNAAQLPDDRARRWMLRRAEKLGIAFEDAAADHLVKATGARLGTIRSELDKLAGLAGGAPLSLGQVADFLGVRHGETQSDWITLVLTGKAGQAGVILPHLLAQTGVSGVSLITLLGAQVACLGIARAHYDRGTRGAGLNKALSDFLFKNRPRTAMSYREAAALWSAIVPQWPSTRIESGFAALRRADERLKNTAVSDEQAILLDLSMELTVPWQRAA